MDHDIHGPSNGSSWIARLVLFAFLGIAGFYLITEHRAHLYGILPWALFAAVPFLCIFMHFGHGHGGHGGGSRNELSSEQPQSNSQETGPGTHRH